MLGCVGGGEAVAVSVDVLMTFIECPKITGHPLHAPLDRMQTFLRLPIIL